MFMLPKQMFCEMKFKISLKIVWLCVNQNGKRDAFTIIKCQPFSIPSFHSKSFVWGNEAKIECQAFHRKTISIIEHPERWQQQMFHYVLSSRQKIEILYSFNADSGSSWTEAKQRCSTKSSALNESQLNKLIGFPLEIQTEAIN